MFLAAIIVCTTLHSESCFPMVNTGRIFGSYEECYQNADSVAQALIASSEVYSASLYCFPLAFGEPA